MNTLNGVGPSRSTIQRWSASFVTCQTLRTSSAQGSGCKLGRPREALGACPCFQCSRREVRQIDGRLPVVRQEGIEIHQMREALGNALRHRSDERPAIAVPEEDHLTQILIDEDIDDVGDMRFQVDEWMGLMGALAKPVRVGVNTS